MQSPTRDSEEATRDLADNPLAAVSPGQSLGLTSLFSPSLSPGGGFLQTPAITGGGDGATVASSEHGRYFEDDGQPGFDMASVATALAASTLKESAKEQFSGKRQPADRLERHRILPNQPPEERHRREAFHRARLVTQQLQRINSQYRKSGAALESDVLQPDLHAVQAQALRVQLEAQASTMDPTNQTGGAANSNDGDDIMDFKAYNSDPIALSWARPERVVGSLLHRSVARMEKSERVYVHRARASLDFEKKTQTLVESRQARHTRALENARAAQAGPGRRRQVEWITFITLVTATHKMLRTVQRARRGELEDHVVAIRNRRIGELKKDRAMAKMRTFCRAFMNKKIESARLEILHRSVDRIVDFLRFSLRQLKWDEMWSTGQLPFDGSRLRYAIMLYKRHIVTLQRNWRGYLDAERRRVATLLTQFDEAEKNEHVYWFGPTSKQVAKKVASHEIRKQKLLQVGAENRMGAVKKDQGLDGVVSALTSGIKFLHKDRDNFSRPATRVALMKKFINVKRREFLSSETLAKWREAFAAYRRSVPNNRMFRDRLREFMTDDRVYGMSKDRSSLAGQMTHSFLRVLVPPMRPRFTMDMTTQEALTLVQQAWEIDGIEVPTVPWDKLQAALKQDFMNTRPPRLTKSKNKNTKDASALNQTLSSTLSSVSDERGENTATTFRSSALAGSSRMKS